MQSSTKKEPVSVVTVIGRPFCCFACVPPDECRKGKSRPKRRKKSLRDKRS